MHVLWGWGGGPRGSRSPGSEAKAEMGSQLARGSPRAPRALRWEVLRPGL